MAARRKPHARVWCTMRSVLSVWRGSPFAGCGGGPAKRKDLSKNHYIIYNMFVLNSTVGDGGKRRR